MTPEETEQWVENALGPGKDDDGNPIPGSAAVDPATAEATGEFVAGRSNEVTLPGGGGYGGTYGSLVQSVEPVPPGPDGTPSNAVNVNLGATGVDIANVTVAVTPEGTLRVEAQPAGRLGGAIDFLTQMTEDENDPGTGIGGLPTFETISSRAQEGADRINATLAQQNRVITGVSVNPDGTLTITSAPKPGS